MKKSKLIVRGAVEDDYPAIARLLDDTFHPIPYEQRLKLWKWRYDDNPARIPDIPPFLVGEQNGEIVGVHGLTPLRVKIHNQILYSACSCDLAVNPKARSAGMKIKLRAMKKETTALPMSTSANEAANKITLSLGGKELTPARRKFIKPLKISGIINRKVASKAGNALGILAGFLAKPIDYIISPKISEAKDTNRLNIADIDSFDIRFDQFWNEISKEHENLIVRDSTYLNWRYRRYPFSGIETFGLFRENDITGFAAIHKSIDDDGLPFIAVLELVVRRQDDTTRESLLDEILRRAMRYNVDTIIAKTLSPEIERLFVKYGFKPRFMSFSPFTYKNNTDMPDEQLDDTANWFTSLGDGDASYYFD